MNINQSKALLVLTTWTLLAGCQPEDTRGDRHTIKLTNETDLYLSTTPSGAYLPPHSSVIVDKYSKECLTGFFEYNPSTKEYKGFVTKPVKLTKGNCYDGDNTIVYDTIASPPTT
jgi:hypothetical protein